VSGLTSGITSHRHPVHALGPRHDALREVSVTFDERGYIGSAPELRSAVVALSLGGLRRKIERCCLMTFASCCPSTASPSANGTVGRRRCS
jgi:hypothetical protein